jgi:hypothetical protein
MKILLRSVIGTVAGQKASKWSTECIEKFAVSRRRFLIGLCTVGAAPVFLKKAGVYFVFKIVCSQDR